MCGWRVVGVVEVVTVVLVVGGFEEAKCPEKREKRLTHFKTMPQAAGKKSNFWKYQLVCKILKFKKKICIF